MSPLVIEVAAGLIFRSRRVLITRRPSGGHLAGLWEFPGGKLETGETFEVALMRELREELGVAVEVGRCLAEVRHDYGERTVQLRFFVCRVVQGEPTPIGCPELAWVTVEELGNYEFPPADRELLAQLAQEPEFGGESL